MAETIASVDHRTYGNWRRVQSVGLLGLGMAGTVLLFAGVLVSLVAMMVNLWLAAGCAAVTGLSLVPLLVRDRHNRNVLQRLTARAAWAKGRSAGQYLYRSGPLSRVPKGRCSLPGVLAQMTATEAKDAYGRPFALLRHPWVNHASIVLTCAPDGAALVDEADVDGWVAHWGAWLANLGNEPGLVGAEVVIESAPDSGARLRQEVYGHLAPDAHPLALAVMREAVEAAPAGSASITCRIALTWSMASRVEGGKRRSLDEMALDIGQRIPSLAAGLAPTGAGPARAMTVAEVAAAAAGRLRPLGGQAHRGRRRGGGRDRMGGCRPGRRPGGLGPLPPRRGHLCELGDDRGAPGPGVLQCAGQSFGPPSRHRPQARRPGLPPLRHRRRGTGRGVGPP